MPTWEEIERRQELAKLLARAAIRLQMNQNGYHFFGLQRKGDKA